ncbi:predicted protein [Naegleria gruberi]|uniref:Predicted protein n=1 Tax=Naegleria gruberi TaxID=5762 RepID=D2VJC4_NAEGR|nr:uncharacterized protein NAEGRDRAFT_68988 [Naegleria gruberi]EFC42920.1 predicted protein [Naegleria gruberi]|eukprot:XP_002675664.1 predicted protein [Naegleria gruberi strain NEG-M]
MDDGSSIDQYRASVTPSPNQVTTVMMSHRPSSSVDKAGVSNDPQSNYKKALHLDPFLPSGAFFEERYLGLPPARDDDNIVTRARTDPKIHYDDSNVLVKHKKYIKQLQQQQEAKRHEKIESELNSERKKTSFSETQAKIRQALMSELDMPKEKVEELMEGKTKQLDQILVEQKKKEKVCFFSNNLELNFVSEKESGKT